MRKGLSSSAAVCVLVVKCFNETYGLGMTQAGPTHSINTLYYAARPIQHIS